ncbi:MAG: sugar-transfer associated ATP-grasp domain-containing protein [Anaerovoracaceae bacterium]
MGKNGRVVDNYGLHGPVDLETGEFLFPAHSGDTTEDQHYTEHPYSHVQLVGMKVPMVKEVVECAKKAASQCLR